MVRGLVFVFTFSCLGLAACSRAPVSGTSKIRIQAPAASDALNKTGGVGALASVPSGRKMCYAVNVTGSGMGDTPSSCGPTMGTFKGFVEPSGSIEIELPYGSGRTIELFGYLKAAGDTSPCPGFGGGWSPDFVNNSYVLGSKPNVSMLSPTVEVEVEITFPGVSSTIASQLSLPSSCTTVPPAPSTAARLRNVHVASATQLASGGNHKILARVSSQGKRMLSNANNKLIVK